MINLQDVLKTFWRCLGNILKMSWRYLFKVPWRLFLRVPQDIFPRRLQDVFKTFLKDDLKASWRRLEDVSLWRIYWSCSGCLQDVLKTSSEDLWSRGICWSWSRRLQDVFTKTNVCWEWSLKKYWRWACRKYQSKKHMEFLLDPTA